MLSNKIQSILQEANDKYGILISDVMVSINNETVCRCMRECKGDELYFLYSTSKPITCTAALQLYEQGKIGLDDPVAKYIPEFAKMKVKTAEGLKDARNVMTIKHLFTMTSGLNYNLESPSIMAQKAKDPNSSTLDIVRAIANEPLEFEPGTRWLYSLSHDVLGAVVEVASGMSFAEYLQKNIFDVCGMTNTYMQYDPALLDRICLQYIYDAEKKVVVPMPKENPYIITPAYHSGGAGIISSVEDYMKFAQTLTNTEKLLKRETVDLMRANHLEGTPFEDYRPGRTGYSYGLGVRTNIDGDFSAHGEFGWDGAAGAYVMMDPDNHIVIFYATHIRNYGSTCISPNVHMRLRDAVYEYLKK